MNKVGLQDIVGGQLQEKFNRAFEKVVENHLHKTKTGMMCRYRLLCLKSWHRSRI